MSRAGRALLVSSVVVAVVAAAFALWELRLLIFLFLLGVTWAAAMRPSVERLNRYGLPRSAGILLHFIAVTATLGLILWLAVPQAIKEVEQALGDVPTSQADLRGAARDSTGVKHELFVVLRDELKDLPSVSEFIHPAVAITTKAVKVVLYLFFALATAAYWTFERDRAQCFVLGLLASERRRDVRATWNLIDLKLGAYVRGQLLTVTFVSVVLSTAFALIGLPFWLLLGVFAGLVEVVPVIGPFLAGLAAVGVGLTIDWQHALYAAIAVWGLRLLQDYVINPHVFGHAVGLSPLIILITVTSVGLLLGGVYVLLSVPLASIVATIVDVTAFGTDPDKEPEPKVLSRQKALET
jgi:predicted PurR-regulated permease PerM